MEPECDLCDMDAVWWRPGQDIRLCGGHHAELPHQERCQWVLLELQAAS